MPPPRLENNMRRLRFERDEMTQQELAERVGVARQTIIAIEGGRYAPSLLLAFQIAAALRTPLEEVFTYGAARGGSALRREA